MTREELEELASTIDLACGRARAPSLLAEVLGVSVATVEAWAQGEGGPDPAQRAELQRAARAAVNHRMNADFEPLEERRRAPEPRVGFWTGRLR